MNQKILQEKSLVVKELSELLKSSSSMVIVKYQGITVNKVEELRNTLKENEVVYGVYKNTLVMRALKECGLSLEKELQGPNAFIFTKGDDATLGLRLVTKFAEDNPKIIVEDGIIDGAYVDQTTMSQLAKLPGKDGLLAMLLSCLQAPIQKFAATVKSLSEKQAEQ